MERSEEEQDQQGGPGSPAQIPSKRENPRREHDQAGMKVTLEGVDPGPRDAVPERHRRRERRRGPPGAVHRRAERERRRAEQQEAGDVRDERCDGEVARRRAQDIVGERQTCLGVEERRVAREERGIGGARRRRQVERLVGRAVPVTRGIGDRERHEQHGAGGKRSGPPHMASSAVGPYIIGRGTSRRRRYTLSWPRWWIV